jgi:CO/xanthine dehydrogenase Mo-binding subunit
VFAPAVGYWPSWPVTVRSAVPWATLLAASADRNRAKGLGEVGTVGVSAAIANAVYHATGRRIRSLPITLDKLL